MKTNKAGVGWKQIKGTSGSVRGSLAQKSQRHHNHSKSIIRLEVLTELVQEVGLRSHRLRNYADYAPNAPVIAVFTLWHGNPSTNAYTENPRRHLQLDVVDSPSKHSLPSLQHSEKLTCAADGKWDTRKPQQKQPNILPRQVQRVRHSLCISTGFQSCPALNIPDSRRKSSGRVSPVVSW